MIAWIGKGMLALLLAGGIGWGGMTWIKEQSSQPAVPKTTEVVSATVSQTVNAEPISSANRSETSFGHWALEGKTSFSLEEMLTYAIQDEYGAYAEYNWIIQTYGAVKPYTNILQAEQTHIDLLLPLFKTYGFVIPDRAEAESHITHPTSLLEAAKAGVQAEIDNIAMYDTFLAQKDLPADVRDVFVKLRTASTHHLEAFQKQVDKLTQ